MIGFAHRGARAHAPENTIEAFATALAMGAGALESDVWLTADGVAVLDHDGVVDATTDTPIAAVLRRELPSHVPTLAELYAECGADFELSLDLKDPGAGDAVLEVARAAGASDRLWLCHHRWRIVASWRSTAPEVRLVDSTYLGFMSRGPDGRADQLVEAGIDAVNLHHSEWTANLVEAFSERGLATLAWDAQHLDDLRRVRDLGVDGAFSDHVDRLVEVGAGIRPTG